MERGILQYLQDPPFFEKEKRRIDMKVLITPRGFANYGTDIVKEMEAKGVTVLTLWIKQ